MQTSKRWTTALPVVGLALGLLASSAAAQVEVSASRVVEIVETSPPSPGGDNWIETIVPGLVVERRLGQRRTLVLGISDHVLGPYFAILDPEEYGVAHLVVVKVGLRFQ